MHKNQHQTTTTRFNKVLRTIDGGNTSANIQRSVSGLAFSLDSSMLLLVGADDKHVVSCFDLTQVPPPIRGLRLSTGAEETRPTHRGVVQTQPHAPARQPSSSPPPRPTPALASAAPFGAGAHARAGVVGVGAHARARGGGGGWGLPGPGG